MLGIELLGWVRSIVPLCNLLAGEAFVGQPETISDTINLAFRVSVPRTVLRERPAGSREAAKPSAPLTRIAFVDWQGKEMVQV